MNNSTEYLGWLFLGTITFVVGSLVYEVFRRLFQFGQKRRAGQSESKGSI